MAEAEAEHGDDAAANALGDVLVVALSHLEPRDLAAPRAVCRAWQRAADAALPQSFCRRWRLASAECCGTATTTNTAATTATASPTMTPTATPTTTTTTTNTTTSLPPRRAGFMQRAVLASFVRVHAIAPGDTFASIAVRYGVAAADVKRANGIISDHSIHAHPRLLVPVGSAGALEGRSVEIRHVTAARRDVAVVLEDDGDGEDDGGGEGSGSGSEGGGAAAAASRRRRLEAQEAASRRAEDVREKLTGLLVHSMRADEATARFYYDEAGGDVKAALAAAAEDARWEEAGGSLGPRVRLAPLRRFIEDG